MTWEMGLLCQPGNVFYNLSGSLLLEIMLCLLPKLSKIHLRIFLVGTTSPRQFKLDGQVRSLLLRTKFQFNNNMNLIPLHSRENCLLY